MPRFAYVNGAYVPHARAKVHIEDRGFQFADGIYEVIALVNGEFADERGHLDRLERSLGELRIALPVARRSLQVIIRELVRRNRWKNASVYIQVTRGQAKRDFKFPAGQTMPTLVVTARAMPFDYVPALAKGIKAITVPDIRWKRRDIKSVALLPQVLAKQAAHESGAGEALMVDDDGFITEGSSSNLWMVTKDGVLVTRAPTNAILKGVTRTALSRLSGDLQLKIEERSFTVAEALEAAELFISSATTFVHPIVELDGKSIGAGRPGPVAMRLYGEYREYVSGAKGEHEAWEEF